MSKTRLWQQNKESLLAIFLLIGLGLLTVVNVLTISSAFLNAYVRSQTIKGKQAIDAQIVGEALNSLTGEKYREVYD